MSRIEAVVCDVEGTVGDIDFVRQTLFPYARDRLPEFLRRTEHEPEVARVLAEARSATGLSDLPALLAHLDDLAARDVKDRHLKALQGLIWAAGYRSGELRAHLYPEVADCLRRWRAAGRSLYVYSSGSVLAQQLYFEHSIAGNLLELYTGHFDLDMGGKREVESYQRIAGAIGLGAEQLLFLSDIAEELDAAAAAGWLTTQVIRDTRCRPADAHPRVADLSEADILWALSTP